VRTNESNSLLEILRKLEIELHQPRVRNDRQALAALLHANFREFGSSGATYTRDEILSEFSDQSQAYEVWSQDYQLELLTPECALLTYRSAHVDQQGRLDRHTNRASLWQLTEGKWTMRFHQGTSTTTFVRTAT
jgi:hypothetical protein